MPRRPLVGNWFEEEAYARDRRRLMQGRSGGLVDARSEVAGILAKMEHHNTPCAIVPMPADGHLRFYAPVMLQNACTEGFLSVDLDDRKQTATGWQVACSTAPAEEPTRRSVVVLVPAPMPPTDTYPIPQDEEDIIHYGQPFYIMTVPELSEDPLFLISEFRTHLSASRVTGTYQNVYFSPDGGGANAMWCADFPDAQYQEDMRDLPVRADAALFLRHNMTSAPLASNKSTFLNDFGREFEVCAGRVGTFASKKNAGPGTKDNVWMFIHGGQGLDSTTEAAGEGEEGEEEKAAKSPQSPA